MVSFEIKEERGEKKVACAKLNVHLEHTPHLDERETKMNLMPP